MSAASVDPAASGALERLKAGRGVRLRPAGGTWWPLGLYAALSLAFFGLPVLPFIGHPSTTLIARDQVDSSLFIWFFAWWPHALLNGLNPFVTHAMFVPEGFNLQWTTAMPGPSLLLAPLTLAAGPEVTFNTIQLLSPALNAWAAYVLCRHLTGRAGPALAGGYAFGFSPYTLAHLTGSPFLGLAAMLPLAVLLVIRRLDGSLSRTRFLFWMSLTAIIQFSISTEVLVTATLFGALTLVLAIALWADRREALAELIAALVMAAVVTGLVVSPFLYYFFFGRHYPPAGTSFSADLLSFVRPPFFLAAATSHLPGAITFGSGESYLGIPLLAVLGLFAWQRRSTRATWLVLVLIAVAVVLSLGSRLHVDGSYSISLPWHLLATLPVLRYAIPIRLALFAALGVAVVIAVWLADRGGVLRWGLVLLVLLSWAPDIGSPAWRTDVHDPAFFTSGADRRYLHAGDRVLTVPTLGPNERWQADAGFPFALAAGYAGAYPASYTRFRTWTTLLTGSLTPRYAGQLRRFVAAKGVTAILVDDRVHGPWPRLFATLGIQPLHTLGVSLYRLRDPVRVSPRPGLNRSSGRSRR